jgi:hypothetical protein
MLTCDVVPGRVGPIDRAHGCGSIVKNSWDLRISKNDPFFGTGQGVPHSHALNENAELACGLGRIAWSAVSRSQRFAVLLGWHREGSAFLRKVTFCRCAECIRDHLLPCRG